MTRSGSEYTSTPDLEILGDGAGAKIISSSTGIDMPQNTLIASINLQINLLEDLFVVRRGVQAILHKIKMNITVTFCVILKWKMMIQKLSFFRKKNLKSKS